MNQASSKLGRDSWRAQIVEPVLEPEHRIVDAHHHVWPESPVPGLEPYSVEALLADMTEAGHDIVASVFVEGFARWRTEGPEHLRPVGETEYASSLADDAARTGRHLALNAAIVGHVDLTQGAAVEEVLEAHVAAAPTRFRGVRCLVAHDPDYPGALPTRPHMLSEPALRAGFAKLKNHGLSFDVWVMHPQLGDVYDLASDHPDTTVVIDHVGGPMRIGRYASGDDGFNEWRARLARLAQLPNTVVKLGGLNMPCTGLAVSVDAAHPWNSEQMADVQGPYLHVAIDLFGPDRCMFESNFPVDRMLTGARALWNSFKRVAQRHSPSERDALFATTASRVYRFDQGTQTLSPQLK